VQGVTDGESKGGDCDEVICGGWGEPGGQWRRDWIEQCFTSPPTGNCVHR